MRHRAWIALAALVAMGTASAAGHAAKLAPLPPHLVSEHPDEDEEDYVPPRPLKGLYGHGFAEPMNLGTDAKGEPIACQGDEAAREAFVKALPAHRTEFWFFATASQGALFVRVAEVDTDKPCATAIRYRHGIERAFVADNMVHSVETDDAGDTSFVRTRDPSENDRQYSGSFNLIHNLMARRSLPTGRRTSSESVAGVRALCDIQSGLVWSSTCVGRSAGPAYGMIVSASAGDDERVLFGLAFDTLQTAALLDGRVFEVDRDWDAK